MAKVFLIDFSSYILVDMASELIKKKVNILYWTGCKRHFENVVRDKEKFSGIIFHNTMDAVKGIPAEGIDCGKFKPPGEDLIEEMLECESLTLTMMTRLDFSQISSLKKKHLYYKYLQYWDGVLQILKPDMIIFRAIPHTSYNFVLYSLAKKYNIKTIMFDTTVLPDNMMLIRDYQKAPQELREMYNKIKDEHNTVDELEPKSRAYFEKIKRLKHSEAREDSEQLVARKNKPLKAIPSFGKIIKNIKAGTFFTASCYYLKSALNLTKRRILTIDDENSNVDYSNIYHLRKIKKITDRYKKEYEHLQVKADFNKKYIYFPLHYQPECNTRPMAKYFADQILIAKILSASIPSDWVIYVKEHLPQWDYHNAQPHLFRYHGYYQELANLKNVKLVPIKTLSFDLIAKSQLVATASGTVGWEALVKNKPVLIFGYPWYMYCDGVFQIKDVKTCKEALEKIINGSGIDQQKILNYLIALEKTSVTGNIMPYMQRNSDLPVEKSVKNAVDAIYKEMLKYNDN